MEWILRSLVLRRPAYVKPKTIHKPLVSYKIEKSIDRRWCVGRCLKIIECLWVKSYVILFLCLPDQVHFVLVQYKYEENIEKYASNFIGFE